MAAKKSEKAKSGASEFDYRTIKSFDDACKKLNLDPLDLPAGTKSRPDLTARSIAEYKLIIIYEAINDGWIEKKGDVTQLKYYPWYWVLSSGFGFSGSYCNYSGTLTDSGSRLCTNTKEKALYMAETFGQEFKEYMLILK